MLIDSPFAMAAKGHRSVRRRTPSQRLVALLLLCLCYWLSSNGAYYSPLQVQVALPTLRADCEPPKLDPQKLKACAPKLLEADQLKDLIAEARDPKRKPRKKPKPRTSPERPGLWRCSACEQWLPETAFNLENRYGSQRPGSPCKECNRRRLRLHHRTLRGCLLQLRTSARSRAKLKPWNATLTFEDLLEIVKRQNGRCAYSGVPMEMCLPNSHWRISLERLNNSKGYSCENCVIVACEFNTGDGSRNRGVDAQTVKGSAQWSQEKVRRVPQLQLEPLDCKLLEKDIAEARLRPRNKSNQGVQPTQRDKDKTGCIYCFRCGMFLSPGNFTESEKAGAHHRCRVCMRELSQVRCSRLRGHLQKCLCDAKKRAAKRGQEFSLTLAEVLEMLEQQGGRCYYSDVPLNYKQIHAPWRLSIERLDNSIGYTAENCVLIAIEFNTADHSRNNAVTEVFGTAQWSREKVEHVWGHHGWATAGGLRVTGLQDSTLTEEVPSEHPLMATLPAAVIT